MRRTPAGFWRRAGSDIVDAYVVICARRKRAFAGAASDFRRPSATRPDSAAPSPSRPPGRADAIVDGPRVLPRAAETSGKGTFALPGSAASASTARVLSSASPAGERRLTGPSPVPLRLASCRDFGSSRSDHRHNDVGADPPKSRGLPNCFDLESTHQFLRKSWRDSFGSALAVG